MNQVSITNASPVPQDSAPVTAATLSTWAKTRTLCQLLILSMPPCRSERTVEKNTETVRICLASKEFELPSFERSYHALL
jgi:hypothetical protein